MTPEERAKFLSEMLEEHGDFYFPDSLLNIVSDQFEFAMKEAYHLGMKEGMRMAAEICKDIYGGPSHKVSENSDVYRIQDQTIASCVKAIRNEMDKLDKSGP